MTVAAIGDIRFRINPSQVYWEYSVDVAVIPTVGGRVVQVYGVTLGDMTIQGLFGQERTGTMKESWQLAEDFRANIQRLAIEQSRPPNFAQLSGVDRTPMHRTWRFFYNDDTAERRQQGLPIHNWDFQVYIKSLKDVAAPSSTISHETGKFSHGYNLTLFLHQDNTGKLASVAKNAFIERLSNGLGWQRTSYQGHMTVSDLQAYLSKNSPDGTIHGLVLKEFETAGSGQVPSFGSAVNPVPGGVGTINAAGGNP
jgi:hypothetical protein